MKKHYLLILLAFICFLSFSNIGTAHSKKIVILNSYHSSYPWSTDCLKGFKENINPEYKLIPFELDTKRVPPEQFKARADEAMKLILLAKPDIVIDMDDNALKFLGQKISDAGIPQVFMGINQNPRLYFSNNKIPQNVTGILERPLLKRSLSVLQKITGPGRYLLMMDNGLTSQAIIETSLRGQNKLKYASCELDLFTTDSFSNWQKKVHSIDKNKYKGIIICNYAAMHDEEGRHASMNSVSSWTSQNSKVPVFAVWKYSLGKGKAAGGLVMSGYNQGQCAAEIANGILRGGKIPPAKLPTQGVLMYSRHELSRWQLKLPYELQSKAIFID